MSDSFLQFVPLSADWQPTENGAQLAAELLRGMVPAADEIKVTFYQEVEFFHCGGNWSGVCCPTCGSELEDWWVEAVDSAFAAHFADLSIETPCCGLKTTLNDLNYAWPVRFGRFVLEARNPNVDETDPEWDAQIARALGSPVAKVWVHL